MTFREDPRVVEAKLIPVTEVLERLGVFGLRDGGAKNELCGPCPICGSAGHDPKKGLPDRFNVNTSSGAFFCRRGCGQGGDQIDLVQFALKLDFRPALEWLVGERPVEVDEKALQAKKEAAQRKEKTRARNQNRYRRRQIDRARRFSRAGIPGWKGVVGAYLRARGLPLNLENIPLKFLLNHPYMVEIPGTARPAEWEEIHRGPAMIADFVNWETGDVMAVHQTWIDPNPPHDKARIAKGDIAYGAKKIIGSMRGNFIPLISPPDPKIMICAEGIENTLTAYYTRPARYQGAAFWAGGSLSNMAGPMLKIKRGEMSGQPDLDSDLPAFVPPPTVEHFIYIQDGDSDPKTTRAQLLCGLRRAQHARPGLKTSILPSPSGFDLNDVLRRAHKKEEGAT